jgi:hypothetical protein
MRPRAQLATVLVALLASGGCGGGSSDHAPTSTGKFSIRETPSYDKAKSACGAVSRETLARSLGLSTTDRAAIAERYAAQKAPLAARQGVYDGCYAALNK